MNDLDQVRAYAARQAGFGGIYRDGEQIVVLFTTDTDQHQQALADLAKNPQQVIVRTSSRTYTDIQAAATRIQNQLLGPGGIPGVISVGITVNAGQFTVQVGVDPHTAEQDQLVREAAAPEPVVVYPQPRPRPL